MTKLVRPVILGIKGSRISKKEYFLFKKYPPLGYIIFSRNIENFSQLKNLITELRSINDYKNTLIMIDHEGGRVNRFSKFFSQSKYSAKNFGLTYENNKKEFFKNLNKFINFNSNLFNYLGINLVAAPTLDLFYKNKSDVIGDRSYSSKVEVVQAIGKLVIDMYKKKKILTIAKHVPGHGLSTEDSHFYLPVIKNKLSFLKKNDLACFRNVKSNFLMTAHIVYEDIDKNNPATLSKKLINELIRKQLNFKGLLMSDDICMKALKGSAQTLANKCFAAGCDIVLHCNGDYNQMLSLLESVRPASSSLLAKIIKLFNYTR